VVVVRRISVPLVGVAMGLVRWQQRRRWSVPVFVRRMSARHPELECQVSWRDAMAIAEREGILVHFVRLSTHGRLLRVGGTPVLQLQRGLSEKSRTIVALHELAHFWRDDPGEPCYYSGTDSQDSREEFADVFAWYVTTPHRPQLREEP
jgi:hypothetical protein